MWYYRSDYKSLLVYCARDVSLGRCAGRKKKDKKKNADLDGAKVKKKSAKVRKTSVNDQPKVKAKDLLLHCPFRLWASWMGGGGRSF